MTSLQIILQFAVQKSSEVNKSVVDTEDFNK